MYHESETIRYSEMIFMLYWEDIQLEVGTEKCSDSVTVSYNTTQSDDSTGLFYYTLCGFLDGIVFSEENGRANPYQGFQKQEFVLTNELTIDFKSDSFGHYKGFLLRIEAIPINIYYAREKGLNQLNITKFDTGLKFCDDAGKVSSSEKLGEFATQGF